MRLLFMTIAMATLLPRLAVSSQQISNQDLLDKIRDLVSLNDEATVISKCITTGTNEEALAIVVANNGRAMGSIHTAGVTYCRNVKSKIPKKINRPTHISIHYYNGREWPTDHWVLFPKSKPVKLGKGK